MDSLWLFVCVAPHPFLRRRQVVKEKPLALISRSLFYWRLYGLLPSSKYRERWKERISGKKKETSSAERRKKEKPLPNKRRSHQNSSDPLPLFALILFITAPSSSSVQYGTDLNLSGKAKSSSSFLLLSPFISNDDSIL